MLIFVQSVQDHRWWGKSANAWFTEVVIKSIVSTESYEFNQLL